MTTEKTPTFATIIVPLDGSELAETAVPLAVAIGGRTGARINLVTVVLSHTIPLNEQMDELTRRTLLRAHQELETEFPGVTQTILAGDPPAEIAKHAASINADLIVMASHGRSGLRKLILGSVADRLLNATSVPVLLVRGGGESPESLSQPTPILRIVVPVDGSEATAKAAPYAEELARLTGADTTLVYVRENGGNGAGETQLGQIARHFSEAGFPVTTEMLDGRPGEAIAGLASERPGTVVVMASISATGAGRGAHRGSVADYIFKNADAAVMIVPPRGHLGSVVE